jgi:hypothetical protein
MVQAHRTFERMLTPIFTPCLLINTNTMRLYEFTTPIRSIWPKSLNIGWWQDQDTLTMYHGTNKANFQTIAENGLTRKDPNTGMISLAFEPNTAQGYASMYGGEAQFRDAGAKAVHVPLEDRIVFVFDIPMSWLKPRMDPKLGGNTPPEKAKLLNKELYEKFDGNDIEYYALTELRVNTEVPANFIVGYMKKK